MSVCGSGVSMRQFAVAQTAELVNAAVDALMLAAQSPGAEAVHKMRVSIRRLQQALRLFSQFLRKRGVDRVRKQLKAIMTAAGELRNHDIAIALVKRLGTPMPVLVERRIVAKQSLSDVLLRMVEPDLRERWTRQLRIEADEEAVET